MNINKLPSPILHRYLVTLKHTDGFTRTCEVSGKDTADALQNTWELPDWKYWCDMSIQHTIEIQRVE
jgi:hypothetical protein